MKQLLTVILAALLLTPSARAQENLQKAYDLGKRLVQKVQL